MPVAGKLELTIKFTQLPPETEVTTDKNGWKGFTLDCDGRPVAVLLRPRMWQKLVETNTNWPLWLAAITGRMGQQQGKGFKLEEPAVQVFERKPKAPPEPPPEPPPIPEG